jgi:hypothetical protein
VLNVHPPHVITRGMSPFSAGAQGRKLRIVVDSHTVPNSPAVALLLAFSRRPALEVFFTKGPDRPLLEIGLVDEDRDLVQIHTHDATSAVHPASAWREHAAEAALEHGISEEDAWRGLVTAQWCFQHRVDGFITNHPAVRIPASSAVRAKAMTDTEGIALVSLYLRATGDFTVVQDGPHATYLVGDDFYRAAAVSMLPSYRESLARVFPAWRDRQQHAAFELLIALQIRLGRALRSRDYVLVRDMSPDRDSAWDDELYFFENFLVSLSGAFDAVARMVHRLFGMPDSQLFAAGWRQRRKGRWLDGLAQVAPDLANLARPGVVVGDTVDQIADLRNSIHGEPLSHERYSSKHGAVIADYFKNGVNVPADTGQAMIAPLPAGEIDTSSWCASDAMQQNAGLLGGVAGTRIPVF